VLALFEKTGPILISIEMHHLQSQHSNVWNQTAAIDVKGLLSVAPAHPVEAAHPVAASAAVANLESFLGNDDEKNNASRTPRYRRALAQPRTEPIRRLLGVVSTVESDDDMDRYCAIVPSLALVAKKAMVKNNGWSAGFVPFRKVFGNV
jgi:hypothetical protein